MNCTHSREVSGPALEPIVVLRSLRPNTQIKPDPRADPSAGGNFQSESPKAHPRFVQLMDGTRVARSLRRLRFRIPVAPDRKRNRGSRRRFRLRTRKKFSRKWSHDHGTIIVGVQSRGIRNANCGQQTRRQSDRSHQLVEPPDVSRMLIRPQTVQHAAAHCSIVTGKLTSRLKNLQGLLTATQSLNLHPTFSAMLHMLPQSCSLLQITIITNQHREFRLVPITRHQPDLHFPHLRPPSPAAWPTIVENGSWPRQAANGWSLPSGP